MRRALPAAMKARDQPAVTALRSALAAIDNAEAVDSAEATSTAEGHPAVAGQVTGGEVASREVTGGEIAGAAVGLGAAEVERRTLTSAEMEAIVREEVAERQTAARAYERVGQSGQAERLRAEMVVLSAYLGDSGVDVEDPGA
jgi:uncharacterized protein YqeY